MAATGISAHWLLKTEPAKYGWDDLVRDGRTRWDGVRNNQAALWLRAMRLGNLAFLYHSVQGLEIVGVVEVVAEAYPDPTDPAGRFVAVDVAPKQRLANPVGREALKAAPETAGMVMFRQFRLSVTPITEAEWSVILKMAA
jgi:predicted RNA-binding protein with PUA-like domain